MEKRLVLCDSSLFHTAYDLMQECESWQVPADCSALCGGFLEETERGGRDSWRGEVSARWVPPPVYPAFSLWTQLPYSAFQRVSWIRENSLAWQNFPGSWIMLL